MSGKRKNFVVIEADKYGRLTFVRTDENGRYWWCLCSCGVLVRVVKYDVLRGVTKSCGCLSRELTTTRNREVKRKPLNPVVIDGDLATMELTQGQYTKIDVCDLSLLDGCRFYAAWRPSRQVFVVGGYMNTGNGARKQVLLHQVVMGVVGQDGVEVDHRNGDTLDNRRENLRVTTRSENQQNRRGSYSATGFRGVYRRKHGLTVQVKSGGRFYGGGSFPDTEEGLSQANEAAIALRVSLMTHSDGR